MHTLKEGATTYGLKAFNQVRFAVFEMGYPNLDPSTALFTRFSYCSCLFPLLDPHLALPILRLK